MAWHLMYFNGIGVELVPIESEIPQVLNQEARTRAMETAFRIWLGLQGKIGYRFDEPRLVWCESLKAGFHSQAGPDNLGIHQPDETAEYEYHGHEE